MVTTLARMWCVVVALEVGYEGWIERGVLFAADGCCGGHCDGLSWDRASRTPDVDVTA